MAKKPVFYFVVLIAAIYSPILAADDISTIEISNGKAIFDRLCANCHRTPAAIQTPAPELKARLVSGAIRQHRFSLSGIELEQVTKYIISVRS